MRYILVAFVGITGAFLTFETASAQIASKYTKHDYGKCPETVALESEGVTVRSCRGLAGYEVQWIDEPDASSVQFGQTRTLESMDIGEFFEVGTTIEWRGPSGGKTMQPSAAIVRYAVGQSIGGPRNSKLVVSRLKDGKSCIMAVVDGRSAEANAKAREIVDHAAESFKCGVSKRIVE